MLKTFGLHGVVLDVDSVNETFSDFLHFYCFHFRFLCKLIDLCGCAFAKVNELVQVETYLRSEGVLVRYWYPIEMLERPPAGSRRTAANGLVSLDSSNIQIHR